MAVVIEDKDRLAELVMMFHYERKASDTTHWKLIGEQDEELLRRSGAEILSEVNGADDQTHCTTLLFQGARFRSVYVVADMVIRKPAAGLPC